MPHTGTLPRLLIKCTVIIVNDCLFCRPKIIFFSRFFPHYSHLFQSIFLAFTSIRAGLVSVAGTSALQVHLSQFKPSAYSPNQYVTTQSSNHLLQNWNESNSYHDRLPISVGLFVNIVDRSGTIVADGVVVPGGDGSRYNHLISSIMR